MVVLLCRINLPKRKRRDRLKELERASPRESFIEADVETASEASSEQDYSYEFAQMEVIMKTLGNNGMIKIICLLQSTLSFRLPDHSCIQCVFNSGFWPSLFRLITSFRNPITVQQNSVFCSSSVFEEKSTNLVFTAITSWPFCQLFYATKCRFLWSDAAWVELRWDEQKMPQLLETVTQLLLGSLSTFFFKEVPNLHLQIAFFHQQHKHKDVHFTMTGAGRSSKQSRLSHRIFDICAWKMSQILIKNKWTNKLSFSC